jgi:hypothetical protein
LASIGAHLPEEILLLDLGTWKAHGALWSAA